MTSNFENLLAEFQRLSILQILQDDEDYSANTDILSSALSHLGNTISSDALNAHVDWLRKKGLIKVRLIGSFTVVQLTKRGLEAAQGILRVDGVRRPGPKD
ncbi:MAG: ArsR family transcriptional regulator [Alphaproteobacteria bacterium]|nr:ArsR family transcriptional regulator [Alphaproteobacteria bacterium]MDD9919764.1 ArsR family transcriptional regulator [Alphaproteobacteria bacterium]